MRQKESRKRILNSTNDRLASLSVANDTIESTSLSTSSTHTRNANRVHFQNDNKSIGSNANSHHVRGNYPRRRIKPTKLLLLKRHADIGFGFSIRGGCEHGTGIFVSNINKYSDAFVQGLQLGDQILRANNEIFEGILHNEAVMYIQRQKIIRLIVLSLGVVPGSKVALTEYQWIDCYGRPCSPLQLNNMEKRGSHDGHNMTSSRRLLSSEDERKVNVVVGNNATLGLLIRGGSEYGLGIFVAGIDQESVADKSGIMVGEQILDVNGIDFLNINHTDAAHIIRSSKMMTMILKDVGKIPLARVVYDKTEWIKKDTFQPSRSPAEPPNVSSIKRDSVFKQGIAGSLLSHQSLASPISFQWVEEKAQSHLNKDEWATLKYDIREYIHENLTVNELGLSLLELLDTNEKMSMISEVRGIVRAQDIEMFDELMLRMEVEAMTRNAHGSNVLVSADVSPKLSRDKEDFQSLGERSPVHIQRSPAHAERSPVHADRPPAHIDRSPAHVHRLPAHVNRSPEKPSWQNDTNDNFNYRQLNEDSYQSTFDNSTEEIMLSHSPQPFNGNRFKQRSLMDDAFEDGSNDRLEPVVELEEEEPLYATVKPKPPPFSPLTEYAQSSPPRVMKSFQSPPSEERERFENTGNIDTRLERMNGQPEPEIHKNNDDDEGEYGTNKLGFAFSFLNSQENSPETPKRNSARSEGENSYMSVTSFAKENKQVSSPPQVINKPKRLFGDVSNNSNIEPSTHVVGVDYDDVRSNKSTSAGLQNFQPKFLSHRNSFDKINHYHSSSINGVVDNNVNVNSDDVNDNDIKIMGDFENNERDGDKNNNSSSEHAQFDLSKNMDKHYSNFSVNDIVRQNFLPTTRVTPSYEGSNGDVNNGDNNNGVINSESSSRINYDNFDNETQQQSLSKVNSLNIQNQYQYEMTAKAGSLSAPTYDRVTSPINDELKTYGKPLMLKSPRPNIESKPHFEYKPPPPPPPPPPKPLSISDDKIIKKDVPIFTKTQRNNTGGIVRRKSKEKAPEIQFFSINRLKKTQNGSILFGQDVENKVDNEIDVVDAFETKERISRSEGLIDFEKLNSLQYPSTNSNNVVSDSIKTTQEINPGYSQTPPWNLKHTKTLPNNSEYTKTSPNNSEFTKTSPRNFEYTKTSPRNSEFTKTSPSNFDSSKTSPRNSEYTKTSPRNSEYTKTSPRNSEYKKTSPRNSEYSNKTSPRSSENSKMSPRSSEYGNSELNILRSSQQGQYVANLRKMITETEQPIETTNNNQGTPEHVTKSKLKTWLKTDLRPAHKPKIFSMPTSESVKKSSTALQSRIEVFSQPTIDTSGKATLERLKRMKMEEKPPRSVSIQNTKEDDPGFTVNISTNEKGQNELYVSEVTNQSIKTLMVGDVILSVDDHVFKAGVKKGLANLIIKNKFNSSEKTAIKVTLK